MFILIGLNDAWKCVTIELVNGCTPCIGGLNILDCHVEASQWFKVLLLETVCVDCTQRIISWVVKLSGSDEESITAPRTVAFDPTSHLSSQHPIASSPFSPGHYSLMAPDGSMCHDDLDHLFDLAKKQFFMPSNHQQGNATWLKLLQCYLLPLVALHTEDLPAVRVALSDQRQWIKVLDKQLMEVSTEIEKLRSRLVALQEDLAGLVESMASDGRCTVEFLKLFIDDLRHREEDIRAKVQLSMTQRGTATSSQCEQLNHSVRQDTATLMRSLVLRDILVRAMCKLGSNDDDQVVPSNNQGDILAPPTQTPPTPDAPPSCGTQSESTDFQAMPTVATATPTVPTVDHQVLEYINVHKLIREQKVLSDRIVKDKLLALSLREALQLSNEHMMEGSAMVGLDQTMGLAREDFSDASVSTNFVSETTSMREQLREIIQSQSTDAGRLHCEFVDYLRREWFHTEGHASLSHMTSVEESSLPRLFRSLSLSVGGAVKGGAVKGGAVKGGAVAKQQLKRTAPPISLPIAPPISLPLLVKQHFQKMVDVVSQHITGCDVNIKYKIWLCYERLFFESCGEALLSLYEKREQDMCTRLKVTSLNVSLLDPMELGLSSRPEPWVSLFQCRDFSVAIEIHASLTQQQCAQFKNSLGPSPESQFMKSFGSVVWDISCLQECISPLDKLKLLVSALRKATSVVTDLRLKRMLNDSTYNISSAAVSGDDLLPLLVLILLQLHPSYLAHLHLQCCLLEDYMAPFLSLGWHGYSLVTFQSAIKAIADMRDT